MMILDSQWYLLSNGTDTSYCGETVARSCKTLEWLLERFHESATSQSLSLITDTSLIIDSEIMVSLNRNLIR